MKFSPTTLAISCAAGLLLFGSGWAVGRQFPARRFERFGESQYLLEPATGKMCNPFKDPKATQNLFDQGMGQSSNPVDKALAPNDPFTAYGGHAMSPESNYPPPCGR